MVQTSLRLHRSFDEPVRTSQCNGRQAEAHQQLRLVIRGCRQNNHFSGHGSEGRDQHQLDLHDMASQIAGDVLQHFQCNKNGEQISEIGSSHHQANRRPARL